MKKWALFLIPILLLATQGVAVTSLYCKGKLSQKSLSVKKCCKDVNKGKCCNTRAEIFKVKDHFEGAHEFSLELFNGFSITEAFLFVFSNNFITGRKIIHSYSNAPPLRIVPLFLLFRAIVI